MRHINCNDGGIDVVWGVGFLHHRRPVRPPDVGNVDGARPQHPAAALAAPRVGRGNAEVFPSPDHTRDDVVRLHGSDEHGVDGKSADGCWLDDTRTARTTGKCRAVCVLFVRTFRAPVIITPHFLLPS